MDLAEHYTNLYNDSLVKIKNDEYQVDSLIDRISDNRFGITLLARPIEIVSNNIQSFLEELKMTEPNQYYYRNSDLHVTIMSIISCYDGFDVSDILTSDYIDLIQKSIDGLESFDIKFQGITASPSCIMVQGFLSNDTLAEIRDNLRVNFKHSDLENNIDLRYAIQTAHSTVVRFKQELSNKAKFIQALEKYRVFDFGSFKVDTLELVYNDWYQRKEWVNLLERFGLA